MRTPLARCFILIALALFVPVHCLAGPLTGQVVDPDGRGVPGATILLVTRATVVATAVTGPSGQFSIDAPDSGELELRVAIEGFRAKPAMVSAATAEKDLGKIALEISAVSESLVVSAAQVEVPLSTASSSVTVITGEDLARHQVETVVDALRVVPGMTVAANGGRGSLTSVFPRGGESDYTLVFVDGIQANSFGGEFDFAHLPTVNIDRVEVVRGPQSALYGSNAIGSVVSIITRRSGTPTASASFEGGSFDTYRLGAATSGSLRGWNWGASTEHLATDNFNGQTTDRGEIVENDDYARHSMTAAGGWRNRTTAVRGEMRYARDERGTPGPFGLDPGGTFFGIDTISRGTNDRWLASAGTTFSLGGARINAETTHSRLDGDFTSPFQDYVLASRRTTARAQADGSIGHSLEASGGFEILGEQADSTFITADGPTVPVERGVAGFFGEARWNHEARIFVNAGLRVDRITRQSLAGDSGSGRPPFDDDTVVSANPKVSAAWFVRAEDGNFTKIRGAAGTGIRPPNALEIAFTDNPSLKPERSRSVDLGIDQALVDGRGLIEATFFFNDYDDLIIATGPFSGASQFRTDNIANARTQGLELAGTGRGRIQGWNNAGLQVRIAYTLLDSEVLAVDRSGDAPPPFTVGDRLLRRPKHQFSADVVLDAGPVSAFLQGSARGDVRDVDPSFGTFGGVFDAAGFTVWNAGASWRAWRSVELFGRITNLFDRDYEETLGFPALGRGAMAGIRVAAGR